jgi:hypothetical protein
MEETLDLLIQEHEQIRSKTRARGRRGSKGDTEEMVQLERRTSPDLPMWSMKHESLR